MRFKKCKLILISSILLLVVSCNRSNKNSAYERVYQFKNYDFNSSTTLMERVQETPEVVLDYLKAYDNRPDYTSYTLSDYEREIVEENLELLPDSYKEILNECLLGIYFIEDFWGSGIADYVIDSDKNIYPFIVLNPARLHETLNEAFLYKEMTCFIDDGSDLSLKVNISDDYNGILYILLHELSHAIDYRKHITPYTTKRVINDFEPNFNSTFISNIWDDYDVIAKSYSAEIFERISFYGFNEGPHIELSEVLDLYKKLDKTPFISLYATSCWAEDLAELYSMQYLVEELGCIFEIDIYENSDLLYTYEPLKRESIQNRFLENTYF